ncbi:peptidyl-prolyl cis-trans isomerase [Gynuella sp.]|uniref:peptidylprolyl isomerase n=1 Tax=Gynuella sp. TaxID=2969146 RepID=UPI003D152DB4
MNRLSRVSLTLFCAVILVSCGKDKSESAVADADKPDVSSDVVWVTVNGSPIHESELDYARQKLLGDQFVDARVEENIRQSLISSRAIAQKAEAELSAEDLANIALATQVYREELLLKSYLQRVSVPRAVSEQMVVDYYHQHPEAFGAASISDLEILKVPLGPEIDSAKVITILSGARTQENWSNIAAQQSGQKITYQKARSNQQLSPRLLSALNTLSTGDTSDVVIEAKQAYVIRVLSQQDIPPRPLSEVSRDIRKRLAAEELKKAIKSLSEKVLAESNIVRKD